MILGGDGDDYLRGYADNDILIGGKGADKFVFRDYAAAFGGTDRILDFNAIEGDTIEINASYYNNYHVASEVTHTHSGTNLNLFVGGYQIATLENISGSEVAGVLEQIQMVS